MLEALLNGVMLGIVVSIVLMGVMGYRRDLNQTSLKVTTFKVKGDLPELRVPGWFIDFTQEQ